MRHTSMTRSRTAAATRLIAAATAALTASISVLSTAGAVDAAPARQAITVTHTVTRTVTHTAAAGALTYAAGNGVQSDAARALSLLGQQDTDAPMASSTELAMLRDRLADAAAFSVGADPARMRDAWARADTAHLTALMRGMTQIGVRYRRNQSNPGKGFDCSGFTSYAWRAAGYNLARQSGRQIRNAAPRTAATAQAGDLVYYPGHVMLWLGVDNFILHSPYTGQRVRFDHVSSKKIRFGDPTA